jgi:hypothetical protein
MLVSIKGARHDTSQSVSHAGEQLQVRWRVQGIQSVRKNDEASGGLRSPQYRYRRRRYATTITPTSRRKTGDNAVTMASKAWFSESAGTTTESDAPATWIVGEGPCTHGRGVGIASEGWTGPELVGVRVGHTTGVAEGASRSFSAYHTR